MILYNFSSFNIETVYTVIFFVFETKLCNVYHVEYNN